MLDIKRVIIQDGDKYRMTRLIRSEPIELQAGVYVVNRDLEGHYLSYDRPNFESPKFVYDPVAKYATRFSNEIDNGDGVGLTLLAEGGYGVGKSMLSEILCNKVIKRGGIVLYITINRPIDYEVLVEVIRSIGKREVMVYFDEFSRIYRPESDAQQNPSTHHIESRRPGRAINYNFNPYAPTQPDIAAQDPILQFFSDSEFKGVHKVLTTNSSVTAALQYRPQRIKYRLSNHNFKVDARVYAAIITNAGIRGEAAAYLTRAFDECGYTIDETLRTVSMCKGIVSVDEIADLTSILNTKPLPSNLHCFEDIGGGHDVRVTLLSKDSDPRYKVEVRTSGDQDIIKYKDLLVDYPAIDESYLQVDDELRLRIYLLPREHGEYYGIWRQSSPATQRRGELRFDPSGERS